jgi:leucyl-tRNA synthetase
MDKYNHKAVEAKWQKKWDEAKLYVADINRGSKPFYNLWMFPYPSAEGLHAGHAFASTGSDIYGRYMRMNGFDVFQPIGYDSFGIHSENYALKINENPHEVVKRTTKHYEEQMRSLGHGYDWTRTVTTSNPDYYKWTQWLFIKMFEAGLAYKKKAMVNFCPSCKTVLADEQVMSPKTAGKEAKDASGKIVDPSQEGYEELKVCERCGTIVEKKDLDQWFFKITKYADRLLSGLDKIDWSERVLTAQRNWIGKSEGMLITFKKEKGGSLTVFTTRPDTLNAVTFIVVADEKLYNQENPEKIGEFTGEYAIDPLSGRKLPIWKTNYIAPGYGTGAVMGVPAHDERDREFAEKYHLDIVEKEPDEALWEKIEKEGWGKKNTNYHLRDWLVSRQRYWGAPIPMIYCEHCAKDPGPAARQPQIHPQGDTPALGLPGSRHPDMPGWFSVPEADLPVKLPDITDYKPEGTGKGPLANHKEFYEVKCPKCGGEAKRETDVMDTFVDSSWYFLRYPSVDAEDSSVMAFNNQITKKWLPVNLYFGGAEHSVLHLMYARFVTMVLHDLGFLAFDEPFPKFFAHGLMIKDGAKMSKSRGNVVNPDEYVNKFGADALRVYLAFMGPMDSSPDFRDSGMEGSARFLNRVWKMFVGFSSRSGGGDSASAASSRNLVISNLHQTIKKVTEDVSNYKYNTALASIMQLVNALEDHPEEVNGEALSILCRLLAPFAPHMMEEVWVEVLHQPFSIHKSEWPKYDPKYLETGETIIIVVQVNGKVRAALTVESGIINNENEVVEVVRKDANVAKWLEGKTIKKTIFVSGKLVNFVV